MTSISGSTTTAETNPLRQALPRTRVPEPCAIVLFGATGDLAHRKLVPALFRLASGGNLPSECAIVGFARRDWTDDDLRAEYQKTLAKEVGGPDFPELWAQFSRRPSSASGRSSKRSTVPTAPAATGSITWRWPPSSSRRSSTTSAAPT